MSQEIYRELARRIDGIPPGFPATDSGIELRLLALTFTPQEAALASVMGLGPEPVAEIAARAGVDPDTALRVLGEMANKELISSGQREGQPAYGLRPFVGGIYERLLPRAGAEMAELFEEYFQEALSPLLANTPAMHRVIPVAETIPFEVEIYPYEQATELLKGAKSWGVRPCACRLQQQLVGKGCDRLLEACVGFSSTEGAFDDSQVDRAITLQEALHILREAGEAGLVHTLGNYRDGNDYICNCCTCCCAILRGVAEFGILSAVAHSGFKATVDATLCQGCRDCAARCQFNALSVLDGISVVDDIRCVGCGLCVTACSFDALRLERRPQGETLPLPADALDWAAQYAAGRGTSQMHTS